MMVYTQVEAKKPGDNVTNGACYFGVANEQTAIAMFLDECKQYRSGYEITARVYREAQQ